jgi:hypothetical protein
VLGIKEKESGLSDAMFQTPTSNRNARMRIQTSIWRKEQTTEMSIGRKTVPLALADQILFPTPTAMDHIDRKGMRPSRAATNRKVVIYQR